MPISTEEIDYKPLVIEYFVTDSATLIKGQNLAKGAVLGQITASGKLTLAVDTANDGSKVPFAILLEDTDATSEDKNCPILMSGVVNEGALVFGGAFDADGVRGAFRDAGIFLKTVIGA